MRGRYRGCIRSNMRRSTRSVAAPNTRQAVSSSTIGERRRPKQSGIWSAGKRQLARAFAKLTDFLTELFGDLHDLLANVGFARFAIRRRCGLRTRAPISGQRALRADVLPDVLPFARGFGMELGMTIDAARAGHRVLELELDLSHRASARTPSGFLHRGRQLADFIRAYIARR